MLRGIPVLASDRGGLVEAHRGVDYTIPVSALEVQVDGEDPEKVKTREDERRQEKKRKVRKVRKEETKDWYNKQVTHREAEHDITPWTQALKEVLGDGKRYKEVSKKSRKASVKYVSSSSFFFAPSPSPSLPLSLSPSSFSFLFLVSHSYFFISILGTWRESTKSNTLNSFKRHGPKSLVTRKEDNKREGEREGEVEEVVRMKRKIVYENQSNVDMYLYFFIVT